MFKVYITQQTLMLIPMYVVRPIIILESLLEDFFLKSTGPRFSSHHEGYHNTDTTGIRNPQRKYFMLSRPVCVSK